MHPRVAPPSESMQRHRAALAEALRIGVDSGEVRGDLEIESAADVILVHHLGIVQAVLEPEWVEPSEKLVETGLDILLRGLTSGTGGVAGVDLRGHRRSGFWSPWRAWPSPTCGDADAERATSALPDVAATPETPARARRGAARRARRAARRDRSLRIGPGPARVAHRSGGGRTAVRGLRRRGRRSRVRDGALPDRSPSRTRWRWPTRAQDSPSPGQSETTPLPSATGSSG